MNVNDAVVSKSKPRRRLTIALGIVVLFGAAAWAFDGWLFARLCVIVHDSQFDDGSGHTQLHFDALDELREYSPNRLLKFLRIPSSHFRAVVCLSLAERESDRNPTEWIGVVPKLLELQADDRDPLLLNSAREALYNLPMIPAVDQDSVWAFCEAATLNDDGRRDLRTKLLATLLRSNPRSLPRIVADYLRWTDSRDDRRAALVELMKLVPGDPETYSRFRWFVDAGEPNPANGSVELMLRLHPELIDIYLKGTDAQRKLLFEIATRELESAEKDRAYAKSSRATARVAETFLTEEHFKHIEAVATGLLKPETPSLDLQMAGGFLRRRPNGGDILFDAARRLKGSSKAYMIRVFHSWARSNPEAAPKYVAEFLPWLRDENKFVQEDVMGFLAGDMKGVVLEQSWLKPHRTGPDSPIGAACRRYIDDFPDRADFRCYAILLQSASDLRLDDVDRIASFAERELVRMERDFPQINSQLKNPAGTIQDPFGDAFQRFVGRHPELKSRPSVKRFLDHRLALQAKKILMPVTAEK